MTNQAMIFDQGKPWIGQQIMLLQKTRRAATRPPTTAALTANTVTVNKLFKVA